MTKPNFLIVGAAKSGTTSLFNYLNQHPDIFIPKRKECRFFSQMSDFNGPNDDSIGRTVIRSKEEYFGLFSGKENFKARGDASVDYLYFYDKSVPNILQYLGEQVKIIIILRNQIERAYSNYMHFVRNGVETLSFREALKAEKERMNKKWKWSWYYTDIGLYYKQVKAYMEHFPNIKIILFDDFKRSPKDAIYEIQRFLGVTPLGLNTKKTYNVSGAAKVKYLRDVFNKPNLLRNSVKAVLSTFCNEATTKSLGTFLREIVMKYNLEKPSMDSESRQYLIGFYKDDISHLERLIGRDLSHWLK